jgi:biotin carboxylase
MWSLHTPCQQFRIAAQDPAALAKSLCCPPHQWQSKMPRADVSAYVRSDIDDMTVPYCDALQPDTGRIQAYRSPGGPGIRLDGALGAGNTVSRYYDSLLTKVGVHDSRMYGLHHTHIASAHSAIGRRSLRSGITLALLMSMSVQDRSFAMANPTYRQSRRCSALSVSSAAVHVSITSTLKRLL